VVVFRYKAFISYSWADAAWGKWLHHAVETYRTPKALIGTAGRHGPVPARLFPLFKDREEEAAGASIGAAVESALGDSEFLIVVCSPRSAQSRWVNHELAWFKTHRDPAKILALIVDGEPGEAGNECFPAALTHRVTPGLAITGEQEDAPLAADARDSGDGKRGARLKLVAAMLGVGLDDLVRRDARRRARIRTFATAGACTIAAMMSVLAWNASVARDEALFQRNESQDLTEFMLTDLRGKLDEVGRLDILETVGKRLMASYDKQDLARLDADALGRRARVQLLLGEIENSRGNLAAALKAYQSAAATTAELLVRDPDEPQRLFDHAQSLYWVGYIAWQRGDLDAARKQFEGYDRMADGLLAIDPNDPKWQQEKSYALSNLGTVAADRGDPDTAARHFATGLAIDRRIFQRFPTDETAQLNYGGSLSWSARVAARRYAFGEAEALYREGVGVFERALAADPRNFTLLAQLVPISFNHAKTLGDLGRYDEAATRGTQAISLAQRLAAQDPANTQYLEYLTWANLYQAEILRRSGDRAGAIFHHDAALRTLGQVRAKDLAKARWPQRTRQDADLLIANLARDRGNQAEAISRFQALVAAIGQVDRQIANAETRATLVTAHAALAALTAERSHWQAIITVFDSSPGRPTAQAAEALARARIATGDRAGGEALLQELRAGGFALSASRPP